VARNYERTWDIIAMSNDLGIPLQINTTITPANFEQIDTLACQLAGPRIVLWSVFFLVPVGRAASGQRITAEQYEAAFAKLLRHSLLQPYAIKTIEAPHYRRFTWESLLHAEWREVLSDIVKRDLFRRLTQGINDGNGTIFVSHVGLIHPSGFLPIVCGMFPLDNVVDVYEKSDVFRGLRDADRLEEKCKVCEYRHVCGGSRARAYAVTGNLYAQEPDCNYLPATWPS
jgi:radical SAM protein with 4Fe4S-binding SPASM domain